MKLEDVMLSLLLRISLANVRAANVVVPVCVCVRVCVSVREREKKRESVCVNEEEKRRRGVCVKKCKEILSNRRGGEKERSFPCSSEHLTFIHMRHIHTHAHTLM